MQQVGLPRLQHFVPIVQTAVKLLHGQLTTKGLPLQIGLQPEEEDEELDDELEEDELDDEEDDELEEEQSVHRHASKSKPAQ